MSSGKLRIVYLGDSTPASTPEFLSPLEAPPDGEGSRQSQFAYCMMQIHPDRQVFNRGINGQRSDEILSRFQRDLIEEKADHVIILTGVNDIDDYQDLPLDPIKKNLKAMYLESVQQNIVPVAATILPYNSSQMETAKIRNLNGWIKEIGDELHIPFAATNRSVADPNNMDRLLASPDGQHRDISGYRSIEMDLTHAIERHLTQLNSIEGG